MSDLRLLPAGARGLLAEVDGSEEVLRLHAALAADPLPGVVDLVPAATTVLLVLDPATATPAGTAAAVRARWRAAGADTARATATTTGPTATATATADHDEVVVPVTYDGADLAEAAAAVDLDPAALVRVHTATAWVVAFCGFAPGFPYCVALDGPARDWRVPRRHDPRPRVPAGAVGLAAGWTGVYPRESPGGWQLVGTTTAALWDVDRQPPALLPPGTRVRFESVGP
ncbi:5-oxoprolinase subunit B family protein [Aquipuribacter nitratireducens]|uniref:Allophanate hydrolase subunit 1 n=1 Tax=Aquipuribacter nitratireducens TaxID=650104 RepID=A0ABW0GNB0_9MICO